MRIKIKKIYNKKYTLYCLQKSSCTEEILIPPMLKLFEYLLKWGDIIFLIYRNKILKILPRLNSWDGDSLGLSIEPPLKPLCGFEAMSVSQGQMLNDLAVRLQQDIRYVLDSVMVIFSACQLRSSALHMFCNKFVKTIIYVIIFQ